MQANIRNELEAAKIGPLQIAVVAFVGTVMIFDGLDIQLSALVAPVIMAEWALSKTDFASVLAAALIGMTVGTPIGGWLGDRLGRRWTLIASVAFFGAATLACSAADSLRMLVALRFIGGLGFGAAMAPGVALVAEWMPRRSAAQAIATMIIGIPLGGMLGAAGATWLLPAFGWRACFFVGGLLPVLFSALLVPMMPESPAYLILKNKQEQVRKLLERAWRGSGFVAAQRYIMPTEVEWERSGSKGVFSSENKRVNYGLWIAFFANGLATYCYLSWIPVLLVSLGMPLSGALRGSVVFGLAVILGALAASVVVARRGSRPTMLGLVSCAFSGALGMIATVLLLPKGAAGFEVVILAGLAMEGAFIGGMQSSLHVLAASAYEAECRSRGVGVASMFNRLGGIASTFAGSAVLSLGNDSLFFSMIAMVLVFVLLGILIVNRHTVPTTKKSVPMSIAITEPVAEIWTRR
jgi:AAHS family 4-hydroxybenzoate transporter-like MFS transporter